MLLVIVLVASTREVRIEWRGNKPDDRFRAQGPAVAITRGCKWSQLSVGYKELPLSCPLSTALGLPVGPNLAERTFLDGGLDRDGKADQELVKRRSNKKKILAKIHWT